MNLQRKCAATRHRLCLAPEVLEDRVVMSAGQGSTFAIMPGASRRPARSRRSVQDDSALFTPDQEREHRRSGSTSAVTATSSTSSSTPTADVHAEPRDRRRSRARRAR